MLAAFDIGDLSTLSRDRQESHEEPHRATAVAESEERAAHVPSDALGGGGACTWNPQDELLISVK